MFGEEEVNQQIVQHPIFKFLEGAQQIQATIQMAPISSMLELYEVGKNSKNSQNHQPPDPPEVIKGLFKEQLRVTLLYADNIAMVADCIYQNEAVLMRLLTAGKKYAKYFD